jgi:peptide/nickel transport system permease protein
VVGYLGGWLDEVAMRVVDVFQSFPAFVLALAVVAVLGNDLVNLVEVLALVSAPGYVRLMRTEVRSAREHGWVEAARAAGMSWPSILFRQVIPNTLRPVLVIAPLNCGWTILTLAGLSFLGLGVQLPEAEWGAMIATGANQLVSGEWWTSVIPGLALLVTVLAFNLTSEGALATARPGR